MKKPIDKEFFEKNLKNYDTQIVAPALEETATNIIGAVNEIVEEKVTEEINKGLENIITTKVNSVLADNTETELNSESSKLPTSAAVATYVGNQKGTARYIVDSGNENNKIEIAYNGTGLTKDTATHFVAWGEPEHDGATKTMRDLSAEEAGKFIGKVNEAAKATQDGNGNTITDTYLPRNTSSEVLPQFDGAPSYLLGIEAFGSGGTVKWQSVGNVSVGSATTASNGFNSSSVDNSTPGWGYLTTGNGYSNGRTWSFINGGGIAIAEKGGQSSMQVDGKFYQQEGQYPCIDSQGGYVASLTVGNVIQSNGGIHIGGDEGGESPFIRWGDGDYCWVGEPSDDVLQGRGTKVVLSTYDGEESHFTNLPGTGVYLMGDMVVTNHKIYDNYNNAVIDFKNSTVNDMNTNASCISFKFCCRAGAANCPANGTSKPAIGATYEFYDNGTYYITQVVHIMTQTGTQGDYKRYATGTSVSGLSWSAWAGDL